MGEKEKFNDLERLEGKNLFVPRIRTGGLTGFKGDPIGGNTLGRHERDDSIDVLR